MGGGIRFDARQEKEFEEIKSGTNKLIGEINDDLIRCRNIAAGKKVNEDDNESDAGSDRGKKATRVKRAKVRKGGVASSFQGTGRAVRSVCKKILAVKEASEEDEEQIAKIDKAIPMFKYQTGRLPNLLLLAGKMHSQDYYIDKGRSKPLAMLNSPSKVSFVKENMKNMRNMTRNTILKHRSDVAMIQERHHDHVLTHIFDAIQYKYSNLFIVAFIYRCWSVLISWPNLTTSSGGTRI